MAKKKILKVIKLQIPGGKANPAPPIGPALGSAGVQIMAFCKEFNAKTQDRAGVILPTVITVYADKTFTFITKQPPMVELIKAEAGIKSGAKQTPRDKVGRITKSQVRKIVSQKSVDMGAFSEEAAMRTVEGTARSMGIDVVEG